VFRSRILAQYAGGMPTKCRDWRIMRTLSQRLIVMARTLGMPRNSVDVGFKETINVSHPRRKRFFVVSGVRPWEPFSPYQEDPQPARHAPLKLSGDIPSLSMSATKRTRSTSRQLLLSLDRSYIVDQRSP